MNERGALEACKFYMISHRTALGDDTADGTGTHSTTRDITNAYLRQSRMHATMARVQWHEARGSRRRSRAGRALDTSPAIPRARPGSGKGLMYNDTPNYQNQLIECAKRNVVRMFAYAIMRVQCVCADLYLVYP